MKGRDILKGLTEAQRPKRTDAGSAQPRPSGSVRALKSELDKIADQAASAKELKESIAREGQIVELDPILIDGARISDRIPDENDKEFDTLKSAIQDAGQQVPILVRPSPHKPERYEAAYGHRRLRAAEELGIPVRTIVRELSDQEMVLAQGQENGPRLDLSFIERALYASRLIQHGHDRDLVCHALGVDKPEVSRLLTVAETIDPDLILAIGPSRKIGRPRWIALSKLLEEPKNLAKAKIRIGQSDFQKTSDSNSRFEKLLGDISIPKKNQTSLSKVALLNRSNSKVGWMQKTNAGITINIQNSALSEFLEQRMPELLTEFEQKSQSKN